MLRDRRHVDVNQGDGTRVLLNHDLATPGQAQFLIATHSPMILSYPGAVLLSLDGDRIEEIDYRETKHFLITRDFLNSPERFFKHLFETAEDPGTEA